MGHSQSHRPARDRHPLRSRVHHLGMPRTPPHAALPPPRGPRSLGRAGHRLHAQLRVVHARRLPLHRPRSIFQREHQKCDPHLLSLQLQLRHHRHPARHGGHPRPPPEALHRLRHVPVPRRVRPADPLPRRRGACKPLWHRRRADLSGHRGRHVPVPGAGKHPSGHQARTRRQHHGYLPGHVQHRVRAGQHRLRRPVAAGHPQRAATADGECGARGRCVRGSVHVCGGVSCRHAGEGGGHRRVPACAAPAVYRGHLSLCPADRFLAGHPQS